MLVVTITDITTNEVVFNNTLTDDPDFKIGTVSVRNEYSSKTHKIGNKYITKNSVAAIAVVVHKKKEVEQV